MHPHPKVTVIMRTKNSDDVVGQALAALFSQSFRDFELIVVDSGSTDGTLDIVDAYPCRLIEIAPEDYFPGPVLNMAAGQAHGELLVFQNSDVVPLDPEALGRLVAAFEDPEVDAAFARQVPRPEAHSWVRRDYANAFPAAGEAPPWMAFSLPLAAMRRSVWQTRPFYDAAWGSEDTEWGHWARRAGRTIRYVPEARVMHSHNYTLRQLHGRRFIEGEADAFIEAAAGQASAALCPPLLDELTRAARAAAADILFALRAGDLGGALLAPVRRLVDRGYYWLGRRHGARRLAEGDPDASVGQRVVLARHQA